jgi:N-acetylmuramoyl-L-alanine amidase
LNFDVEPIIEEGRTLVPLRAIFEAIGANVQWEQSTQTVKAVKGSTEVILKIGSLQPAVNGKIWPLDVPAKIVRDRTLAPLRFVGEAFGGQVEWEEANSNNQNFYGREQSKSNRRQSCQRHSKFAQWTGDQL